MNDGPRIWALLPAFALGGLLAAWGGGVLWFAHASDAWGLDSVDQLDSVEQKTLLQSFERWSALPGVTGAVRAKIVVQLLDLPDQDDAEVQRRVEETLVARPTSPGFWALLAWYRLETKREPQAVEAAMELSYVLEGREPAVRLQRIEIGLAGWKVLSDRVRARVVADLIASKAHLKGDVLTALQTQFSSLASDVRWDVLHRLQAGPEPSISASLGLES